MADRPSKFSGMFEPQPDPAPAPLAKTRPAPPPRTETLAAVKSGAGRIPGKRSHPDYKQFSVLLKKQTHRQAARALEDLDNGQDLSDLMQQLLEQWVNRQHKKQS